MGIVVPPIIIPIRGKIPTYDVEQHDKQAMHANMLAKEKFSSCSMCMKESDAVCSSYIYIYIYIYLDA